MSIGRFTIDGNGTVHVKNESAYWIPEMTVMEVIHGTTYIVTGSYEGTESIYRNLERIMERKATALRMNPKNLTKPMKKRRDDP